MDPQQRIILSLLHDTLPEDGVGRLNALGEGEWRRVIATAEVEGLAPLLLSRIQRLGLRAPQATRARLHGLLLNNTARNLQLLRHFEILAAALHDHGIDFMPLKGVYLCSRVYENPGERTLWDIDLIVPPADLKQALAAIEATGYKASRPYDLELEIRNYHHVPAYLKPGGPPLEIHWALLNPRFGQDMEWHDLWGRSVAARVGAASVRVPCAEDLLVYLCAHVAYQHMYIESIRSLYDIKLVLKVLGRGIDWDVVRQRAEKWRLQNSLYLSLHLTDQLLGPVLPDPIREKLRPPDFKEALVEAAVSRLLDTGGVSPVVSAVWTRRGLPQRIRGLWDRLAVAPAILAGRYGLPPNSWRVYLYYPVRAWDLLRIHGTGLLGLLLGGRRGRQRAALDADLVAYLNWWR